MYTLREKKSALSFGFTLDIYLLRFLSSWSSSSSSLWRLFAPHTVSPRFLFFGHDSCPSLTRHVNISRDKLCSDLTYMLMLMKTVSLADFFKWQISVNIHLMAIVKHGLHDVVLKHRGYVPDKKTHHPHQLQIDVVCVTCDLRTCSLLMECKTIDHFARSDVAVSFLQHRNYVAPAP